MTINEILVRGSKKDPPIPEVERIRRCLRIANAINQTIKDFEIRHVGIEGFAFNKPYQAHQLGEVAGVVKSQLWLKHGLIARICAPTAGRKHVLGYGGSVPKMVIKKVVEEGLGVAVDNDHEADATVVARWTFDTVVAEEQEI